MSQKPKVFPSDLLQAPEEVLAIMAMIGVEIVEHDIPFSAALPYGLSKLEQELRARMYPSSFIEGARDAFRDIWHGKRTLPSIENLDEEDEDEEDATGSSPLIPTNVATASSPVKRTLPVYTLILTLTGHTAGVFSVAWSPDRRRLASASYDKTVCIWDVASGQLLTTLKGHAASVNAVAWSPDGRRLASATGVLLSGKDMDNAVRIWDTSSWKILTTFTGHVDHVKSVAWSPDGQLLASISRSSIDPFIRVWNAASGQPRLILGRDELPKTRGG